MEEQTENVTSTSPVSEQPTRPKREYHQISVTVDLLESHAKGLLLEDENGKETVVESPYTTGLDLLCETFRANTGNWIFRTIEAVHTSQYDYLGTQFFEPNPDGTATTTIYPPGTDLPFRNKLTELEAETAKVGSNIEKLREMCTVRNIKFDTDDSPAELLASLYQRAKDEYDDMMEKQVETHYKKFFCYTSNVPMRPGSAGEKRIRVPHSRSAGDSFETEPILLDSQNYGQPDFFVNMDFKLTKTKSTQNTVLPRAPRFVRKQKCTDIACILAVPGKHGRGPEAKVWFVCSPQLLNAWTLILYKKHNTYDKLSVIPDSIPTDERDLAAAAILRKKVFSGNHTITNSYLGWMTACYQNGLVSETSEVKKRFWNLRTEYASRAFLHIYSALVMMMRYQELPGPNNIPNKLDDSPKVREWHLPQGWLQLLMTKYEIKVQDTLMRIIDVPVVVSSAPPKGTRFYEPLVAVPSGVVDENENAKVEDQRNDISKERWGDLEVEA